MAETSSKSGSAFRTIGELSQELGLPQHILRYWETRFPQLRPLQRAGKRRYYRPEDVVLVRRIDALLNKEGYTVRGVQKLLAGGGAATPVPPPSMPSTPIQDASDNSLRPGLISIRDRLSRALAADGVSDSLN